MKTRHHPTKRRTKNPNVKQTLAFRLPPRLVKAIRLAARKSGMDMTEIAEGVFRRHLRAVVREHVQEHGLPQMQALDREIEALLQVDSLNSASAAPPPLPAHDPASAPLSSSVPPSPASLPPNLFPDIAPTEDNTQ